MIRALLLLALAGCRQPAAAPPDSSSLSDGTQADATEADASKAAPCAVSFGNALTNSFGRVDGTILAVVPPGHPTCPAPNGTHLVLQVTLDGAAYRMVVNLDVLTDELDAPLAGSPWAEGWHPGEQLDYVSTLHATSADFVDQADPVAFVTNQLDLGAHVSVFATSSGGTYADSAHLVHRNGANADGAIVIHPDTAPHYLLFRFSNQTF